MTYQPDSGHVEHLPDDPSLLGTQLMTVTDPITGTEYKMALNLLAAFIGAIVAATACSTPPAPVGARINVAILGLTVTLTPALNSLAWAVLHDGISEVGNRTAFAGPTLPALVPLNVNNTTTIRVFNASQGGTMLATSVPFAVSP